MRRRQFLLTGLASVLAAPAGAQEQKPDADLAHLSKNGKLWYLLTALDTLIFTLAVAVLKEPSVIFQARREI